MIANLKEDEQHRHLNGGGYVANTASVEPTVFIGPYALVYGEAKLTDKVQVLDSAQVSGKAQLSGDVIVSNNAWVDGNTKASTGRIYKNIRVQIKAERIR